MTTAPHSSAYPGSNLHSVGRNTSAKRINRTIILWLTVGLLGFCLFPWYMLEDGFWSFEWLDGYPYDTDYAPALFLLLR